MLVGYACKMMRSIEEVVRKFSRIFQLERKLIG